MLNEEHRHLIHTAFAILAKALAPVAPANAPPRAAERPAEAAVAPAPILTSIGKSEPVSLQPSESLASPTPAPLDPELPAEPLAPQHAPNSAAMAEEAVAAKRTEAVSLPAANTYFQTLPWRRIGPRQELAAPPAEHYAQPGAPEDAAAASAGESAAVFFSRVPWQPHTTATSAEISTSSAPTGATSAGFAEAPPDRSALAYFQALPWQTAAVPEAAGIPAAGPVGPPVLSSPFQPPERSEPAAVFFQSLPWKPHATVRPNAETTSPLGLGAAIMMAATRSALLSADRAAEPAFPPAAAAGYFQTLPWRHPRRAPGPTTSQS